MENLKYFKKCLAEKKTANVVFNQIDKEKQQLVAYGDGFTVVMPLRMVVTVKDNNVDSVWNTPLIGRHLGESLEVYISRIDEKEMVVECSRDFIKAKASEEMKKEIDEALAKEGGTYTVRAKVLNVFGFGKSNRAKLVTENGIRLSLHCSGYSYDYVENLKDHIKVGDEFDVVIYKKDYETSDTDYLVTRLPLLPNPWEGLEKRFKPGDIVIARIVGRRKGVFNARVEGVSGIVALATFPDRGVELRLAMEGKYLCEVVTVYESSHTFTIKPFAEKRNRD